MIAWKPLGSWLLEIKAAFSLYVQSPTEGTRAAGARSSKSVLQSAPSGSHCRSKGKLTWPKTKPMIADLPAREKKEDWEHGRRKESNACVSEQKKGRSAAKTVEGLTLLFIALDDSICNDVSLLKEQATPLAQRTRGARSQLRFKQYLAKANRFLLSRLEFSAHSALQHMHFSNELSSRLVFLKLKHPPG